MSAAMRQIAIMAAVLGSLVWLAVRRSKPRGARRSPRDPAWSSDAVYNIGDARQYHGITARAATMAARLIPAAPATAGAAATVAARMVAAVAAAIERSFETPS